MPAAHLGSKIGEENKINRKYMFQRVVFTFLTAGLNSYTNTCDKKLGLQRVIPHTYSFHLQELPQIK